MAYTTDKKSTGLDVLTGLDSGDLHIVGDISDSGRAKAITQNNLEIDIANSNNFVDTLVANNYFTTELANDTNFVNELTTNTTFQSAVNNFVTVVGGGGGSSTSSGKPISFSPTWTGSGHQQGYVDKEAILYSNNGSQISFQSPINGIQYRNTTSDWASSAGVQGYVLMGDYLYLLLAKGGSPLEQRLYRYDASDLSLGGTLMTISGQAFGIAGSFQMTSDGVYFYFSSDAGTTANDYEIAKYSLSGTTLTYVSTTTCGSTPTQFASFTVDSSGQYIGYDTQVLYVFDNTGTLTDTIPLTGGSASTSFLNWTNTIYFKNANQDFVKLDLLGTDVSSSGNTIVGIANEDLVAGDKVGISNIDSGFAKPVMNGYYIDSNFGVASVGEYKNIQISTDTVITLYENNGDFSLKVRAYTVDPSDMQNALTFGTAVTVSAAMVAQGQTTGFDICKLDDNKFIVTYTASGTFDVRTVIGTVSGTTITLGTPQIAATVLTGSIGFSLAQISTDKGIITYYTNGGGGSTNIKAFTVSGTTATFGSAVLVDSTLNSSNIKSAQIATDKFALLGNGKCQIGTISGTTITLGTASTVFTATSVPQRNQSDILKTDTDSFVVLSRKASGGFNTLLNYVTVSGTTITAGTELDYPVNIYNFYYVNSTSFYVFGTTSDVGQTGFVLFDITAGNVVLNKTVAVKIGSAGAYGNVPNLGGYFFIGEISTSYFSYFIGGMSNNFIGIVQNNTLRGGTCTVMYSGVDSNQIGLSPGALYVVGDGGSLTLKASNSALSNIPTTYLLLAKSNTEVVIKQ